MEDFGVNVSKLVKIESACETPGMKIRSKGKGRGLARGGGRGPIGVPYREKMDALYRKKRSKKAVTVKSIENDMNKIIGDFNAIENLINKKSKTYYATVAGEKALKLIRRGVEGAKKIKGKIKRGVKRSSRKVTTEGMLVGGGAGIGGSLAGQEIGYRINRKKKYKKS